MHKKKVFIVGATSSLIKMFEQRDWEVFSDNYRGSASQLMQMDLLCFGGNPDVTPDLYGEKNTHSHFSLSQDVHDLGYMTAGDLLNIPMAGVCRGGQLLHVYHGGKMCQHIEGHGGTTHPIKFRDSIYEVTSDHHQEMLSEYPWVKLGTSTKDGKEEIILYDLSLCFQPHPEWVDKNHECQQLFFDLIQEMLDKKNARS